MRSGVHLFCWFCATPSVPPRSVWTLLAASFYSVFATAIYGSRPDRQEVRRTAQSVQDQLTKCCCATMEMEYPLGLTTALDCTDNSAGKRAVCLGLGFLENIRSSSLFQS